MKKKIKPIHSKLGTPKALRGQVGWKHRTFRHLNSFYRMFDHFGKQLAEANKNDETAPIVKLHRIWDFHKSALTQSV